MSIQLARREARELLRRLGMDRRAPIDVLAVAKHLGLPVVEDRLGPDVSGVLVSDGAAKSYIIVQADNHPKRKRFTVAHELAHFYLRHQFQAGPHVHVDRGNFISQRGTRAAQGVDPKEIEANTFAAELLMPEQLLRSYVDGLGVPQLLDQHVESLAGTFNVSEQAMAIRLTALRLL